MFTVNHIKNKSKSSNYIEVSDASQQMIAKIDLNLGGSLQELVLNGKTIISSEVTLPYDESYASAILFPFANRIENGQYTFNNTSYQLHINKLEENNALHGLVYNKPFKIVHHNSFDDKAVVHLRYIETEGQVGFPFKYIITLTYVLKLNSMELIVEIKNSDTSAFPFTVGWHPYFVSSNLHDSFLNLDCSKRILVNSQGIPTHEELYASPDEIQVKNEEFDDCYVLNNNSISFKTPDYKLNFSFSSEENFLQLYTPKNRKTIAIEPQTGSANNFNDERGLKILQPKELFEVRWNIQIE